MSEFYHYAILPASGLTGDKVVLVHDETEVVQEVPILLSMTL